MNKRVEYIKLMWLLERPILHHGLLLVGFEARDAYVPSVNTPLDCAKLLVWMIVALVPYAIFSLFHALTFTRTTLLPQFLPPGPPPQPGAAPTPHPLVHHPAHLLPPIFAHYVSEYIGKFGHFYCIYD